MRPFENAPTVQLVGSAVLLQREAVLVASRLIDMGIERHQQINGISASAPILKMQSVLHAAAGLALEDIEQQRRSDVQAMAQMSPSNKSRKDEIDAREAARILGLSHRQITRIAPTLNGWGGSQGKPWTFSRAEVESYRTLRQSQSKRATND